MAGTIKGITPLRVLLVEDDMLLGKAVKIGLEQQGHSVDWVRDGQNAEVFATANEYNAMLLDLGLPKQDGMSVLANLRRQGWTAPVLIITALDQVQDRVAGLDAGADDFVVKPFDLDELGARLRAVVRRASGRLHSVITHGQLRVDVGARAVTLAGTSVSLTPREFTLLLQMLEYRGQVLSRARLEECVYNWAREIESNTVEVHIHHLRRKLGKDLIRTVHGIGYTVDILN
jgi:DNA-binding response OmpR family regulator